MGERSESSRQECEAEVDSIASRLVTFLAALHEYPAIRYKQGKVPEPGDAPGAMARSLLTQHLAEKVRRLWCRSFVSTGRNNHHPSVMLLRAGTASVV
jgi:hypothetical protein